MTNEVSKSQLTLRKETQMANSTRRALLRDGGVAAGAAALISLSSPEVARAENQRAFFTSSHFNGSKGHLKFKRIERRKRSPLSKGKSVDFFKPMWVQISRPEEKATRLAA